MTEAAMNRTAMNRAAGDRPVSLRSGPHAAAPGPSAPVGHLARWPLVGMVLLAVGVVAITGLGRVTGFGVTGVPASVTVAAIDLTFEDLDDGSVVVRDSAGATLAKLPVSTDGFIRGAMRSLVRDRKRAALGQDIPFRLERRENGRLSLSDPATGGRIELDAFGPSNSAAFARFLPAKGDRP